MAARCKVRAAWRPACFNKVHSHVSQDVVQVSGLLSPGFLVIWYSKQAHVPYSDEAALTSSATVSDSCSGPPDVRCSR